MPSEHQNENDETKIKTILGLTKLNRNEAQCYFREILFLLSVFFSFLVVLWCLCSFLYHRGFHCYCLLLILLFFFKRTTNTGFLQENKIYTSVPLVEYDMLTPLEAPDVTPVFLVGVHSASALVFFYFDEFESSHY